MTSNEVHRPVYARQQAIMNRKLENNVAVVTDGSAGIGLGAVEERVFHREELEIARALATQAGSAVQLIRLVQAARQSAVLKERNRLAAEIHDSLAPRFAGIAMQLAVAEEELTAEGAPLCRVRLANRK